MSQHKVTTVVEGYLTSLFVSLEGLEIDLSYDGDQTYQSTDLLNIDDTLNLIFHPRGIAFAGWTITITLDDAEEPLFKRSGQLSLHNESLLNEAIPMPKPGAGKASSGPTSAASSKKSPHKS